MEKVNEVNEVYKGFKYILGITSLWILIPIYFGFITYNGILTLIMAITCTISTLMWYEGIYGSLLYKLDLLCARLTFVSLILLNEKNTIQMLFAVFVLFFYILTSYLHSNNMMNIAIWGHIMFRYTAFWWLYVSIVLNNFNFIVFVSLSSIYFSHILYSMRFICTKSNFKSKSRYFLGCMELLSIIILYLSIYEFVTYYLV
jgi:hypothetical protein